MKEITLKELAKRAFEMPMKAQLNFSLEEEEDYRFILKTIINDGKVVIIGSFGGGSTYLQDIEIDGGIEEFEHLVNMALSDDTSTVFTESQIETNIPTI